MIVIKPVDPSMRSCQVHDVATDALPQTIIRAMVEAGPEGVDVCRECLERARDEAKRRRDAKRAGAN